MEIKDIELILNKHFNFKFKCIDNSEWRYSFKIKENNGYSQYPDNQNPLLFYYKSEDNWGYNIYFGNNKYLFCKFKEFKNINKIRYLRKIKLEKFLNN